MGKVTKDLHYGDVFNDVVWGDRAYYYNSIPGPYGESDCYNVGYWVTPYIKCTVAGHYGSDYELVSYDERITCGGTTYYYGDTIPEGTFVNVENAIADALTTTTQTHTFQEISKNKNSILGCTSGNPSFEIDIVASPPAIPTLPSMSSLFGELVTKFKIDGYYCVLEVRNDDLPAFPFPFISQGRYWEFLKAERTDKNEYSQMLDNTSLEDWSETFQFIYNPA